VLVDRALSQLPFFRQLPAEHVEELARLGRIVEMPAGQVVCAEGESSDSMYVVLAGEVLAYRHGNAGSPVEIRRFGEGDFFGEVALLDSRPRTATVSCVTECRFLVIEQAAFREVLTSHPAVIFGVLTALGDRAREQIEERYQVELSNLTLEAEAELERHRSLNQMVAGVAHELNTPLGITSTAVDMLAQRLGRPEVAALFESSEATQRLYEHIREATTLAQRNIARAHDLVQKFKKMSVDQLVEVPQAEDLAELVSSVIALFSINARQAGLTIDIDDQLPATDRQWFGCASHLTHILLNLLTNIESYAYEPGVGGPVEIVLAAVMEQPTPIFVITVRDHGSGIGPENLEKVFDPFFTTGRSKGGTGLGLSIVHNIVTGALKGTITVDSTPGEGTTFHVRFPQEAVHV
jgi:signal transduction histidine kinase